MKEGDVVLTPLPQADGVIKAAPPKITNEDIAIWIDIEGFSHIYRRDDSKATLLLHYLASDVFELSALKKFEDYRFMSYALGDGYIIQANRNFDIAFAVSLALMRRAIVRRSCVKIGVGLGGMADIQSCYSKRIQNVIHQQQSSFVVLEPSGSGFSINPVIGLGLINAHDVSKKQSGPCLLLTEELESCLPNTVKFNKYKSHIEIDWLHSSADLCDSIMTALPSTHDYDSFNYRVGATAYQENLRNIYFKIQGFPILGFIQQML